MTERPVGGRAGRDLRAAIGVGVGLVALILASLFIWRPAFLAGAREPWEICAGSVGCRRPRPGASRPNVTAQTHGARHPGAAP